MIKISRFLLLCFLTSLVTVAYSQSDEVIKPRIKLETTYIFTKKKDQKGSIVVSEYKVNGKWLRLIEEVFTNEQEIPKTLESRLKKLQQCSGATELFYKKKRAGQSYLCSWETNRILIYSFGDKIYEILSDSDKTIEEFTKQVLPLSCHLHGSKGCISMFY